MEWTLGGLWGSIFPVPPCPGHWETAFEWNRFLSPCALRSHHGWHLPAMHVGSQSVVTDWLGGDEHSSALICFQASGKTEHLLRCLATIWKGGNIQRSCIYWYSLWLSTHPPREYEIKILYLMQVCIFSGKDTTYTLTKRSWENQGILKIIRFPASD